MKFTIQRSKWYRGKGTVGSRLLRESDGKQCCMGQAAEQFGVPLDELRSRISLCEMGLSAKKLVSTFFNPVGVYESAWVETAYGMNDSTYIDDPTREQQLSALAAANGHEFAFVD